MISNPESVDVNTNKNQCWDCPSRTGVARIFGKLAIRAWNPSNVIGRLRIDQQRQGCEGFLPVKLMRSGSGSFVEENGRALTKNTWQDVYVRACPKIAKNTPEYPDEVRRSMDANNLNVYVHEYTDVHDRGSIEEVEQERIRITDRYQELMQARSSQA